MNQTLTKHLLSRGNHNDKKLSVPQRYDIVATRRSPTVTSQEHRSETASSLQTEHLIMKSEMN